MEDDPPILNITAGLATLKRCDTVLAKGSEFNQKGEADIGRHRLQRSSASDRVDQSGILGVRTCRLIFFGWLVWLASIHHSIGTLTRCIDTWVVFFLLYPCLYTGTMPTQLLPHVYAEWKGCLRGSFPRLGAYAGASAELFVGWPCNYLVNDGKSAHATLPTQQKSTLLPRVPTHTYADCEISGRQPTYKEFSRIHNAGHSKKNDAHMALQWLRINGFSIIGDLQRCLLYLHECLQRLSLGQNNWPIFYSTWLCNGLPSLVSPWWRMTLRY